jgi:serine/threonine-protein kinase
MGIECLLGSIETNGSYRVIGRLSRGGMGDILLADHRQFDGTSEQVVLKLLAPELQEEPYVSMFMSEATVMSRLDHPNVVRLLDLPIVNGSRCLALELVQGTNLYQLMRQARRGGETVPPELAVYVGLEVLAGLAYAHSAKVDGIPINLVHRDVKPGNVLLSNRGEVKLTDFGISKHDLSTLKTSRGVVKGTPHYLSPEQVKGDPATARSDLFSLAAVLVEVMSGVVLFKRETLASTLLAVCTGDRARVERLVPRDYRALARVLERALSVDPSQRFESAPAMASAIIGACPIDDTQAKRELARRVATICDNTGNPLRGESTPPRMSTTGAYPLEPNLFGDDAPTDESPELPDFQLQTRLDAPPPELPKSNGAPKTNGVRPPTLKQLEVPRREEKPTKPIRPPPLPRIEDRNVRNWTFILGILVGALAMCGLQAALQILSW